MEFCTLSLKMSISDILWHRIKVHNGMCWLCFRWQHLYFVKLGISWKLTTIVPCVVMNQINLAWDLTMMITSDLPLDNALRISQFTLNSMRLTSSHQLTFSITDTPWTVVNCVISVKLINIALCAKTGAQKDNILTCLKHCLQNCMQTPSRCIGTPLCTSYKLLPLPTISPYSFCQVFSIKRKLQQNASTLRTK